MHEEEPIRFSLASPEPLPAGLLVHTRHVFRSACGGVAERSPTVPSLQMLSLFGVVGSGASALERLRDELCDPALALDVDYAPTCRKMIRRGPRLIVSDVDSTFIRDEAIDVLADTTGSGPRVTAIAEAAMNGELGFAEAFAEHTATLEGLPTDRVESIASRTELAPGAGTLVVTAHTHGCAIGLVSDGFIEVIGGLAYRPDVDCVLANRPETNDGTPTGRVEGGIVIRGRKVGALRRWSGGGRLPSADLLGGSDSPKGSNLLKDPTPPLEARGREDADAHSRGFPSSHGGIDPSETVAAGDGANDLPIMEIAGLSIAVCVKPTVLVAADAVVTQPHLDILAVTLGWDTVRRLPPHGRLPCPASGITADPRFRTASGWPHFMSGVTVDPRFRTVARYWMAL